MARLITYLGMFGCALMILAACLVAWGYRGKAGERYSPFNHFISELGEVGVARRAWVMNAGLIAGGLLLIPYLVRMGLYLGNIWSRLGIAAGLWAAVSCALVGVFPMHKMEAHVRVANSFFRGGMVAVLLFTLAIWTQSEVRVPRWIGFVGLGALAAYLAFLAAAFSAVKKAGMDMDAAFDPAGHLERPRFWPLPILEWSVFAATMIWLFCLGTGV